MTTSPLRTLSQFAGSTWMSSCGSVSASSLGNRCKWHGTASGPYYQGDDRVHRGGPEGFWEVMEGHPTTGSILQRLTQDPDNGDVLYRSSAQTDRMSVRRNRNNYHWKSSAFVLRKLQHLWEDGPSALTPEPAETEYRARTATPRVTPGNASMAKNLVRLAGRALRNRLERTISFRQWFVAYSLKGSRDGHRGLRPPVSCSDSTAGSMLGGSVSALQERALLHLHRRARVQAGQGLDFGRGTRRER